MSAKQVDCGRCGATGTVYFGGAPSATFTCGACSTPSLVFS